MGPTIMNTVRNVQQSFPRGPFAAISSIRELARSINIQIATRTDLALIGAGDFLQEILRR